MAMALSAQRQKMLEFKEQLEEFCKSLNNILDDMDTKLRELVYCGLPEDIHSNYVEYYYQEDAKAINDLVETIYSAHFKHIDDVIIAFKKAEDRK